MKTLLIEIFTVKLKKKKYIGRRRGFFGWIQCALNMYSLKNFQLIVRILFAKNAIFLIFKSYFCTANAYALVQHSMRKTS